MYVHALENLKPKDPWGQSETLYFVPADQLRNIEDKERMMIGKVLRGEDAYVKEAYGEWADCHV